MSFCGRNSPPSSRLRKRLVVLGVGSDNGATEQASTDFTCAQLPTTAVSAQQDGVQIRLQGKSPDGIARVALGGPVVPLGYRNLPDHAAFAVPVEYRTDLGRCDASVLSIVGRAHEAISTGGLTVIPQVVGPQY